MATKKEQFIKQITELINNALEKEPESFFKGDALDYWNALLMTEDKEKTKFTENGKLVLQYMQENKDVFHNLFKAKEIGEGLSISSRTVSGAMRKLVTDGYAEKMGESPVVYSLTSAGSEVKFDAEEN